MSFLERIRLDPKSSCSNLKKIIKQYVLKPQEACSPFEELFIKKKKIHEKYYSQQSTPYHTHRKNIYIPAKKVCLKNDSTSLPLVGERKRNLLRKQHKSLHQNKNPRNEINKETHILKQNKRQLGYINKKGSKKILRSLHKNKQNRNYISVNGINLSLIDQGDISPWSQQIQY